MPVKSKRQARWFFANYKKGKITKKELEHWTHGVNIRSLPEKVSRATRGATRKKRRKRG